MRSSSLPMPSPDPRLPSWLDLAIAICICILALATPVFLSIVATPHYPKGVIQTADMFPNALDNLR